MGVDVTRDDAVATVTMNRPEALNAFNSAQLRALLGAFRELRDDRLVRCVILTGAGTKAFAAGADIKEMVDLEGQRAVAFARLGHAVANAIEELPKPVIAAVNGFAIGGGSEVALACDIRLAADNAQFAQPEVSLGIPPGWGATQRLPRVVGPEIAAELIFTGRRIKADEALRIGLVSAVYPADRLLPEALRLATAIAANSPRAVTAAKQAMALSRAGNPSAGLDAEAALFAASFGSADQREGMRAFLEKRRAVFES